MGDILTLIEKAEAEFDEEKGAELTRKMKKNEFDFNDFLDSMQQMKKLGGIGDVINMIPGLNRKMKGQEVDDKPLKKTEAIILSMTPGERRNPKLINPSRKIRIAKGAGVQVQDVNRLLKQFDQMKQMMKQMTGKRGKRGGFGFPF